MKEITIHRLEKKFGDVHALKAADLKIPAGSFTTLLGPSGCGKTTLLRLIAGLETPDAGEILIDDEFIFSGNKRISHPIHRRNFGMVFQDFALLPHLTVFENVAFGIRASKQKRIYGFGCRRRFDRSSWRGWSCVFHISCLVDNSSGLLLPEP